VLFQLIITLLKLKKKIKKGEMSMPSPTEIANMRPLLMGQCAGAIHEVLPAKDIVEDMVRVAIQTIHSVDGKIQRVSKL